MAMEQGSPPSEQDVQAVEEHLAALAADLPAPQQAVLATLVAAGLDALRADDTRGNAVPDPLIYYRTRRLELQQVWRRADQLGPQVRDQQLAEPPRQEHRLFQPLVEFFRRTRTAPPQTRPAGDASV